MSDLQATLDMLDNLEPGDQFDLTDIRNIVAAARRVANMKTQERTVMGQDDDGAPNGKDYIERRLVSEWRITEDTE